MCKHSIPSSRFENAGWKEWNAAKKAVKEAAYWKALDNLEKLLIAQMFEMARLNVSGTGEFSL
jgi:hypothetical protein